MKINNNYIVTLSLLLLLMSPSIYFSFLQYQENSSLDQYLKKNNLIALKLDKTTAFNVSDQIRSDFNTNESSFTSLDMMNRPFLRESSLVLLNYKEGLCGEGTRLIVNLLNRLGFNATRITLYNSKLQPAHTLVSVVIDKKEFLVDSINSSQNVNDLLKRIDISSNDFNLMHYSSDPEIRRKFIVKDYESNIKGYTDFFNIYWLYSYEATPYSKLITKLGFDVRIFNFKRPNHYISNLAEKPYLIMALVSFIGALILFYLFRKLTVVMKKDINND